MAVVSVVGGGVVGLTIAHELAVAGHRVVVHTDVDAEAGVSGVAAALWFPHAVDRSSQVLASAAVTYARLTALAGRPETGVRLRSGRVLSRRPAPDLAWTAAVPGHEVLDESELPPGATGVRCTLPVVLPVPYLRWLRDVVLALGVRVERRTVTELPTDADVVVVAAGLRSAALLGDDDEVFPVRGQVVRLANPGLRDWLLDEDHPRGLTYVVPRDDDVVCGGTGEVGSWDEAVHPDVEAAVLERVTELVPELRGQPVLSRATGLRPARTSVRLGPVPGHAVPVVACYGHGGAGYTLSWGDAARVVELLRDL